MSLNRIEGKLAVNLVNTAGPQADNNVDVFDDIPQVGSLKIKIHSRTKPKSVTLKPAGKAIVYEYADGKIEFTLPHLKVYEIVVKE